MFLLGSMFCTGGKGQRGGECAVAHCTSQAVEQCQECRRWVCRLHIYGGFKRYCRDCD